MIQPPAAIDTYSSDEEIDLRQYIGVLLDGKWLIAIIILLTSAIGVFVAITATPIYKVDALIQIEDSKSSSIAGLDAMSALLGEQAPTAGEIEIIRSRKITGAVVDQLRLDIHASPNYFPKIGRAMARHFPSFEAVTGYDVLKPYAWSNESIIIDRLDLSSNLLDQDFRLLAEGNKHYAIYDGNTLILRGEVGETATAKGITIFISQLDAKEGVNFSFSRTYRSKAIDELQSSLSISEKGKATSILSISMESAIPEQSVKILNAIANVYLRQNVERKSEEAQRSLEFLNKQLPKVKAEMNVAESALNEYRLEQGSIDLKMETQAILDRILEIEGKLSSMDLKMAEVKSRFTENHPVMKTMLSQRLRLYHQKEKLLAQVKLLPKTEQNILRLAQAAKGNAELYTFLLNKSQELKVVKAGTVGNVRIIDYASLPYEPIKPKKVMIVLISIFLGVFIGVLLVFVRYSMRHNIEDPDFIEQKLGLSLYAVIPYSDAQARLSMKLSRNNSESLLLAELKEDDLALESLRSLRTNLHFALLEAKNNIVMLTGPSPELGKSFVAANFAYIIAEAGQRVLVIDGDMRRGHLSQYIGEPSSPGLSDVISGRASLDEAIIVRNDGAFSLLPKGTPPPNPSELLMHENFTKLIEEVSYIYDVVIIDTPPVLPVTDAVLIGKHAATNFLLVRSGMNSEQDIRAALQKLKYGNVTVNGVIFNGLLLNALTQYSYGHYIYSYESVKS
ncbi:MAG: polysaccharide biosynthesis tyrosine autokinase [Mariprofundaceae bacterium]|nr:polysaccharide biosynthesis tyrosine autokinase [Mariprofundaceae bacterium]